MNIQKKISLLALLAVIFFAFTAKSQNSKMAIIQGVITSKTIPAEIALYNVVNGDVVQTAKVNVAKDGTFGFCFTPEYTGFYKIGEKNSPARIYISPGKQTSVVIKDMDLTVTTLTDKENLKVAEWNSIIVKLRSANLLGASPTFKDIFPILPDLEAQKDAFIAKTNTGNKSFDRLIKGLAQAEFEYELYHFLFMPRTAHPKFEEHPPMYKKYSSGPHFATTEVLNYDFGQAFIASYLQYLYMIKANEGIKYSPELSEKMCIENIKNDTLKGWYFLSSLVRAKAFDQVYREKADKYKQYILSDDQKKKLHDFELTIRKFGDNEPAIDFDGKTVEGKKVSLSDFKGKVVVVDVWATWCGPCKGEIPSLQKLEEEMKGQDVVFISYSIDDMKDHDKWIKFVADEKLGGVQIMGDLAWKSGICLNYKINAIPRFMVFNKQNQIVSIDAPRPSTHF